MLRAAARRFLHWHAVSKAYVPATPYMMNDAAMRERLAGMHRHSLIETCPEMARALAYRGGTVLSFAHRLLRRSWDK